jgi:polyvinyl alcohol dehydrogenase (cytochrome)
MRFGPSRRTLSACALGVTLIGALSSLAVQAAGCDKSTPPVMGSPDGAVPPAPLSCDSDASAPGDWPMYGQNVCNTRAAAADSGLSASTAAGLGLKWKLSMQGDVSATPAVVGGQLYVPDWSGMLSRIDVATQQVKWSRSIADILGVAPDAGADGAASDAASLDAGGAGTRSSSVVVSRGTPVVAGTLVITGTATSPAVMFAVNQDTGALVWQTTLDTNPYALIASSPAIEAGRIYVGVSSGEEGASFNDPNHVYTFRGSVVALDATTGKIMWQTPMIDDSVYFNADRSLAGFAGAAVWSGTPTIDRKRHQLYVTTGNNYAVPPGLEDGGDLPAGDHVESILALDIDTGKVRWSERMTTGDVWTFATMRGPDWDFGCGANLFQAVISGTWHDIVGAGQKSGVYWAVDADTGTVLWHTQVGPGGHLGGIHWGTAVDGQRIYVGVNDELGMPYHLGGHHPEAGTDGGAEAGTTSVGSWAALDPATGEILWQVANPSMTAPLKLASVNAPLAVYNGVVFAGSMDDAGTMFALSAGTGDVLWSYPSGATVYGGPAIADGVVYWGNGYPPRLLFGSTGQTLFAFAVGADGGTADAN